MNLAMKIGISVAIIVLWHVWEQFAQRRQLRACLTVLAEHDYWVRGRHIAMLADVSRSGVYVLLEQLERRELILSKYEPHGSESSGLPLRLYRITDAGRAQLGEQR